MRYLFAVLLLITAPLYAGSSAFLTWDDAAESGYEGGAGILLSSSTSSGMFRPHVEGRMTSERKRGASSGYTYSASLGGQVFVRNAYVELGGIAYGYRSTFRDDTVWQRHESNVYGGVGYEGSILDLRALYFPEDSADPYRSRTGRIDAILKINRIRLLVGFEESRFTYTLPPYEHLTSTAFRVGAGWSW